MHGTFDAASLSFSFAVRRAAGTARRASLSGLGKSNGLMKSTRSSARRPERPLRPTASADRPEGLAGRKAGLGRSEQHVDAGELRGLAGAPEGSVLAEARQLVGWLSARDLQRGPEGAGRHGVHADAFR